MITFIASQLTKKGLGPCHTLFLALVVLLSGCTTLTAPSKDNPLPSSELRTELEQMRADPVELDHPVVVIDGWLNYGGAGVITRELKELTGGEEDLFVKYNYPLIFSTLESNARKIVKIVEERWPSDDPEWTTEIDVVGFSMGGLIARVAAEAPREGKKPRKRLKVKRLFTISAPHKGTGWWIRWAAIDQMSWAVSLYGGNYRTWLNERLVEADYDLYCYGQGNDWISGNNFEAAGHREIKARGQFMFSHTSSYGNYRHLADIAARLRGEDPIVPDP
jgi:pimeloyl-ACP methyl ester carboxylesterase